MTPDNSHTVLAVGYVAKNGYGGDRCILKSSSYICVWQGCARYHTTQWNARNYSLRLIMVLCVRTALIVLAGVCVTQAQQVSFADQVYPVLQSAGCAACHNGEGVASATRLRFPEERASKMRLQAFGKSLVEFVNRTDPDKSLLLLKPTLRIPHTGGERIRKATPEEKVLRSWIAELAAMPPAEVASALEYRKREATGSAKCRQWSFGG